MIVMLVSSWTKIVRERTRLLKREATVLAKGAFDRNVVIDIVGDRSHNTLLEKYATEQVQNFRAIP